MQIFQRISFTFLMGCLLLSGWQPISAVSVGLPANEGSLNPSGVAYEINPDPQGVLWISDYDAGEVWGVNPTSGAYQVVPVGGAPSDARHQGDFLWWADYETNTLGRVSTQNAAYTHWQVASPGGFYGTALDAQGRFWAVDILQPHVVRIDAALNQLCAFHLPQEGVGSYLLYDSGFLWLGDWVNSRLLRLKVDDNSLAWWSLPDGSDPWGMVADGAGNIWYTDPELNRIVRLNPSANQVLSYSLPIAGSPAMITVRENKVWFTEQNLGSLGVLHPELAASSSFTPATGTGSITPDCAQDLPYTTGSLSITTGQFTWGAVNYPVLKDAGGWQVYDLPGDQASPWGITAGGDIYFVDGGRQVLGRIPLGPQGSKVFLPVVIR